MTGVSMMQNHNTNLIELLENELRISHIKIAEQTENKPKSILDLITKNKYDLEEFGQLRFKIATVKNSVGAENETKIYFLNEAQATLLMTYLRNSETVKNFKKVLVKEFFKMRELLQNGKPHFSENYEKVQTELLGLETSIRILNVNEASKILMTKTLYKKIGLETSYLPDYSDEQHTYSLSHLLKKFKVPISAKKLNQILISNGILEIKTRKSKSGEKSFKSLTEKGLEFGKNLISPHNQLETQPHYFESKFQSLLNLVRL
jgi:phage regulator Rha-like protein